VAALRPQTGVVVIATQSVAVEPPERVEAFRRTRRHPRMTQFDYLHVRYLVNDLARALRNVRGPVSDVLDVYCGTRPYDDLLPSDARCIGLDIVDRYGVADVVTDEFLPFPDASFDLVMCISAFQYVGDPDHGVDEIRRVLRPGGAVIISVPLVWEYERTALEHRWTGPELEQLFDAWERVEVVENGGRAVTWATLTGRLVQLAEQRANRRRMVGWLLRPAFLAAYALINCTGIVLDFAERRVARSDFTLPMNLLVSARRDPKPTLAAEQRAGP
jgi:SAM-dependent methyltransferase